MIDQQKLVETIYSVVENAERLESMEAGQGEIVRLEVELLEVSKPQELIGRSGSFFKLAVEYSVLLETEKDVEESYEVETEKCRRTLRLSAEGKVVGVSDRL